MIVFEINYVYVGVGITKKSVAINIIASNIKRI